MIFKREFTVKVNVAVYKGPSIIDVVPWGEAGAPEPGVLGVL